MLDPRIAVLDAINLDESRVEYCSSHIVLLCGGRAPEKNNPDDPDPPTSSLRHALVTNPKNQIEFFKPEDVTNWQVDAAFKNLIDLEVELAAICSLVVIILESPGAIAELGAFSQLEEFNSKIVAICSQGHFHNDSFIKLGIFRHIKSFKESAIKSYPWQTTSPPSIAEEIIDDVVYDVQDELNKLPKTKTFKKNNNCHVFVLICELIALFVALKETEILEYLAQLGIVVSKEKLRGKLFLLERFQLINAETYSDSLFYLAKHNYHRVSFATYASHPIDKLRIQVDCSEYYKDTSKHNHRSRAIRRLNGTQK